MTVGGTVANLTNPRSSIKSDIGPVPEDRHAMGFVAGLGVAESPTMSIVDKVSRRGVVSKAKRGHNVGTLSGGNQQKVVIGRALANDPQVLILQRPTMGVDIASNNDLVDPG